MPAPQACAASRQNATSPRPMPWAAIASAIARELVERGPEAATAAGGVLEHERGGRVSASRRRAQAPGQREHRARCPTTSRATPTSTPVPRCDPIWTLTNRAPNAGAPASSRREHRRPSDRRSSRPDPGRLTRYDAWIAIGRMSSVGRRGRETSRAARDGSRRRRQAVGLSAKIWSALAPIAMRRSIALTMPGASGRCAPSRRPSGSIRRSAPPAVALVVPGRVPAADDRLDHAEVAVPSRVEDRDLLGLRVHEDEELVPRAPPSPRAASSSNIGSIAKRLP